MNLAQTISSELGIDHRSLLLLRHGNTKTNALRKAGASLEEYTLVQPTGSKYDFSASKTNMPAVLAVAVIVNDRVYAVYKITGVEKIGTTRSLTSAAFNRFDIDAGYPEKPAKKFAAKAFESRTLNHPITGWTSPRNAVARYGSKIFDSVECL